MTCPECGTEMERNERLGTVRCQSCGIETEDPHIDHDDEPPWDPDFGDDDGPEGSFLTRA